jgi:LPS sulfotransferase NodH
MPPSNPTTRLTEERKAFWWQQCQTDGLYLTAIATEELRALLAEVKAATAALNIASEEMAGVCASLEGEAAEYWLERWHALAAAAGATGKGEPPK